MVKFLPLMRMLTLRCLYCLCTRMLQKFPDTRCWLDSPDKQLLHFFPPRTFLQQLRTLPCGKTTCSTPQPRLIWVWLEQPSWTLDLSIWWSQTGYPSVVSSLPGIGRCCREKGLANMVDAAAAASLSYWESQPLLLLCVQWHGHNEEKGHGIPFLGSTGIKLWRLSGESDALTSLPWLSICPQEE